MLDAVVDFMGGRLVSVHEDLSLLSLLFIVLLWLALILVAVLILCDFFLRSLLVVSIVVSQSQS